MERCSSSGGLTLCPFSSVRSCRAAQTVSGSAARTALRRSQPTSEPRQAGVSTNARLSGSYRGRMTSNCSIPGKQANHPRRRCHWPLLRPQWAASYLRGKPTPHPRSAMLMPGPGIGPEGGTYQLRRQPARRHNPEHQRRGDRHPGASPPCRGRPEQCHRPRRSTEHS